MQLWLDLTDLLINVNSICCCHIVKFHCAYIRYEKGLSVEEIWSVGSNQCETDPDVASAHSQSKVINNNDEVSVELTFEAADENDNDEDEIESVLKEDTTNVKGDASEIESSRKSPLDNYEMVNKVQPDMEDDDLDDLDAEIAKELAELDDI